MKLFIINIICRNKIKMAIFLLIAAYAAINALISNENQLLVYVLSTQLILGLVLFYILYNLEKQIPIFDLGYILIFLTILYCSYPLFSFAMSGFQWADTSDFRLRTYNVSASDLGKFALHHLTYIIGLIVGYLAMRRRDIKLSNLQLKAKIDVKGVYVILFMSLMIEAYFYFLTLTFPTELPYFLMQINHNLASFNFVLLIAFIYYAFTNWENRWLRAIVFIYLLYQIVSMIYVNGGRTYIFLTIIATFMIYHRVVETIKFRQALFCFSLALIFFLFLGFKKVNLFIYFGEHSLWAATNEFTSLLGTAYDLYFRKEIVETLKQDVFLHTKVESLPEIPKSLFFNDILLLIPSQLLPFYKWSTSQWYLEVIGLRGTGVGMMFGVISQAVIGGGMLELLVRGLFLGVFAALFHNFYLRNANLFWVNISYIFIATRIYNTYRAGTGYIFYDIVYQLIPCIIVALALQRLVNFVSRK